MMETLKKRGNPKAEKKSGRSRLTFFFDENLLAGMAGIFDLFGRDNRLLLHEDPWQADWEALHDDWHMIGQDMWVAVRTFEAEHREEDAGQKRLFDPDDDSAKT